MANMQSTYNPAIAPEMLGIKETARRLNIPEYTVRQWAKGKLIPTIPAGNKCLINFTRTVEILNNLPYGIGDDNLGGENQ